MKIKPAPLTNDLNDLKRQLENAATFTDEIDIDIVNWDKSDFKTLSLEDILSIETRLKLNFDLMVDFPSDIIKELVKLENVGSIILYLNCKENLDELIDLVKSSGKKVLISFDSPQDYEKVLKYSSKVDGIQIYTVNPGAQGNPFRPDMLEFADNLRTDGFLGIIGVDGGVNLETASQLKNHPIDYASVGSAISKADDPKTVFMKLNELVGN